MNLKYKYISTNPAENCVEVRFYTDLLTEASLATAVDAEGNILRCRSDVNIMLPYPAPTGVDLEAYVLKFAQREWFEHMERNLSSTADQVFSTVASVVGQELTPGQSTVPLPADSLERAKALKKAAIANWRYSVEVAGIVVGGAKVRTDRESQGLITGAMLSLQSGALQAIDWKDANGVFVQLDLAAVSAVAAAVAQHVQSCFTQEKTLASMVDACTTVEEVNSVVVPALGYAIPAVTL